MSRPRKSQEPVPRPRSRRGNTLGKEVVDQMMDLLQASSRKELARHLDVSVQALHHWSKRDSFTPQQIATLVSRAMEHARLSAMTGAIRPIVEFYPIEKAPSRQEAGYELFSVNLGDGSHHPYRAGLRSELKECYGIYIFFDSRGQAIYVGKARRQCLWNELKMVFNRARGGLQKIRRVNHPSNKTKYTSSNETARQIVANEVKLHDLAAYVTAYEVPDGLVNELEALLVRSFSNDLLNKRMERFGRQKQVRTRSRRHRKESTLADSGPTSTSVLP